jgi:c-di-GMP-binding flagellar brake protein YcgR
LSSDRHRIDILLRQAIAEEAGEQRQATRYPLHLRVAIVYHQHADVATRPRYHGRTSDISTHGLSVLVEHNIFHAGEVTILLALPPVHPGIPQKIIEATAKMVYTVLSAEHDAFRIGLLFKQFKRNGSQLLDAAIAERFTTHAKKNQEDD